VVLAEQSSRLRSLSPMPIATLVLALALVAWLVTIERMRGMDMGPGTDLGALGWFLGVWVTMMAAMMLPSVLPMVLIFARVSRERFRLGRAPLIRSWVFVVGYLAVWTAFGLLAYGLYRLVDGLELGFLAWDEQGPLVVGGAIVAAGLYQLTPLKEVCLRHCRGPMHFVLGGWRAGRLGAVRMGAEHGLYCVGCCWGLMVVLFALGVMSVFWMAVVAGVIFLEKVTPLGARGGAPVSLALVALGLWIAAAPGSVPGLTEPDMAPAMEMGKMSR
jgi:predicted metal-binding membrane protein